MNLAVIPARGGSKRIPLKNIKDFCGKPIIAWTIEAAVKSNCFDRIIVSTDSNAIANIAISYGAEVPFERPADLSDDHATTAPVIAHAIKWFSIQGEVFENACCLYPTAPFIEPQDLISTLRLLQSSKVDFVFPMTKYSYPIQRALCISEELKVKMFNPESYNSRSQDMEETYHDAGQFYWGRAEAWLSERPIFTCGAPPFILPNFRVQDIDTAEDWFVAEVKFLAMRRMNKEK
ncbi:pseudaminic acid cytidylyltransferase [Polynucleobacter paneuropaeus]|uniref:Pseudaminic acid cytidylyltransferase n=1 Tax=Polynucleobacter paneuropaeus TaxID=2527775 RepID=A0A9Q2WJP2_9BURK|nr:pseudaminic acid cytidylyltransferase [Polynucleobacter paneuropaeus]